MVIEVRGSRVLLCGTLQTYCWPAVRASLSLALQEHPYGIVIDCSQLNRVTDEGIQTFAAALQYIETTDLPISLAHLPERIERDLCGSTAKRFHDATAQSAELRILRAIYSQLWWERLLR